MSRYNPPTLRLLHDFMNNDVTGFCTRWYDLGLQLLEERNGARILNEIECDYPNNASRCCIKMFEKWLQQQPRPSWNQLLTALNDINMNNAAEQIKDQLAVKQSFENSSEDDGTEVATEKHLKARTLTKLNGKYANIVNKVQCIIERKNLDIKQLILNICATDEENVTIFSTDEAFIRIQNTNELFLQIGKYCSMYDFDLLLAFVESTECQEAVKLLDDFTEELERSILKDLNLLSEDGGLRNPKGFMANTHKLVIKYVGGSKCTLKAKEKIQNIIYECFHLKKGCITFKGVQEGCVAFVYQISAAVKAHMMQIKVTPDDVTTFAKHHIMSVSIDDEKLKISYQRHYRSIEEMYADSAPQSLIDQITCCVFCDPVVSPSTGNTYSRKTVIDCGMKDPYSKEIIDKLIPNRNKQEEIEKFYMDKFKETLGNLVSEPIDVHVELIVELIAMVVDRSDLQACLNGQRLLIELIQSSTEDQLTWFKAKLSLVELEMVAKLVKKQNATILKDRLGIDISSLANTMLHFSQPTPTVPPVASAASVDGSDDEEEYDFSDTESTTSSVSYTDDRTYVFVDKMPRKTTVKDVKQHFHKFDNMVGKILFIKGSNRTQARLTFKTSESASEAIEMMNGSYLPNSSIPIVVKIWVDEQKQKPVAELVKQYTPSKKSNSGNEPIAVTDQTSTKTFSVHVGKIPNVLQKPELEQIFAKYGKISSVYLNSDQKFAYVNYLKMEDAKAALDMNNKEVYGSKLRVNIAVPRKSMESAVKPGFQSSTPNFPSPSCSPKETSPFGVSTVQIKHLSPLTTKEKLTKLVECYGSLTSPVHLIKGDPPYAYVNYATVEAAKAACLHLHGQELDGKKLQVKMKDKPELNRSPSSSYSPKETSPRPSSTIQVKNLSPMTTREKLTKFVECYGSLTSPVHIIKGDPPYAYVNYASVEAAKAACSHLHGQHLDSKTLQVKMKDKPDFSTYPFSPKEISPHGPFTIQVKHLNPMTTWENLTKLVKRYGSLTSPVHLIKGDPPYAYVNYATVEAAKAACSHLHGQELDGKKLQVKMKDKSAPNSPSVPPMTSTVSSYAISIPPLSPFSLQNIPQIPSLPSPPRCAMPGTVPSVMLSKQRHASARFNKFLHEKIDLKLREFATFGGLVKWNNDCLTIEAPSMRVLNKFEIEVLNVLEEDKIVLSSEDWNKLMLMRPDKTSLYHLLVLPYRTNPNVNIEPHDATLTICIVGVREAVQNVKATILSELNKEIIVEEVKMMALLLLEPKLKVQSHQNFKATMEGFYLGSTKTNFSGSSQSVEKAREWFISLLGQYKVLNYQCQATLIPSIMDRFTADSLAVALCVKCNNGTICYAAQYTASQAVQVMLLACGKEPAVQRAMDILTHPEESTIVFGSMEVLQNVKSQSMYDFNQLSQQHKVYIHELITPTVTIRGYVKDCITEVEKILSQAKANHKKCTSILSGSKLKLSCLTKALAQQPDQARIFFITVFHNTSVRITHTGQTVRLTGPADKIKHAEKMIEDSEFLKGYCNQSFEFKNHPNFMAQIKEYLTKKFSLKQLNVTVSCTADEKGHKASEGDLNESMDTFNVCIESEDTQHFSLACQIVKEVKPDSRFVQMPKRDFDCVSQAVKNGALDIEGVHQVRFELQDTNRAVAIHGLTVTEINAAENDIRVYVNANVPVKLSVKVSNYQKYFLAEKCAHLQENCIIHYPKASDFKKEDQGELSQASITLQGDRSHVEVTKEKIDAILSSLYFIQIKHRHEEYGNMWKRRWEEIKQQEEEAYNSVLVITQFDFDDKGKKKPKELEVTVELTITGNDTIIVSQVEQNIKNVRTTLIKKSLLVSKDQCKSVTEALKAKKLMLLENHIIEIEIDQEKKEVILVGPGDSEDFEAAFATLTAFVNGETVCKEIFELGEPSMSLFIHQKQRWSEIIEVAKKCSVRVKHANNDLEMYGKGPDIVNAKVQLVELLAMYRQRLGMKEISVPPLLESILKTLEFQNLISKLQQSLCVAVTCSNMQRNVKMVTLYKATVKPEDCNRPCIIEVCHGNMVDETADVIVNAANSQLQHAGGLAKAISDAGGPLIQQTSDHYVRQHGIVKPGHVACLPSGNLSCSVVMHAVGPMWKDGGPNKREELYAAVSSSLVESDKHGYKSISIPAISAGIYGCPVQDCAAISMKATIDLLNGNCLKSISHIRFVLFTWDAANAFKAVFKDSLQQHKILRTSADIVDRPSGSRVQWYWEDDSKNLQPYYNKDSLRLSRAYAVSPNQRFQITIWGFKYDDISDVNAGAGKQQRVHKKFLDVVTWQYKDNTGKWTPYMSTDSDLLEVMYETKHMQTLEIDHWTYSFDFNGMIQINTLTGRSRSIRRYVSQSSNGAAEKSISRQESLSASVSLSGPHQHLTTAHNMIQAHFKKCLTTKEISLPASVSNSVRKQMICLGQKYNVQADYVQQLQKVKFHGVSENVMKAVLAAQDILLDMCNKNNIEIPKEWEPQTNNTAIKNVSISSPEWKHVAQLVKDTLPQVDVMKIERIQNRHLWDKYSFQARRMKEKNNGTINEKELFHGTRGTSPEKIYAGEEEGFDMRFSRSGMWGQGNYFAEKASYSDTYAYQYPNGTKQFFLAKVLTGDSIQLKSDTKLRMPPVKEGSTRYDTVNGVTHGCRVYISYSNDKAYPFYLITYT